jgi:phospholipase C
MSPRKRTLVPLAALVVAGWGCAPAAAIHATPTVDLATAAALFGPVGDARLSAGSKIRHIVVILQENRSMDDLFHGFPGADTRPYGYDSSGNKIALTPEPLEAPYQLDHSSTAFFTDCNGTGSLPGTSCRMNGFTGEECLPSCPQDPQYGYVPHDETKPYFDLAHQYVLADRMFTSHIDGSFVSHQYSIAGQASHAVDYPISYWGCQAGPTDTVDTLTSERTYGAAESPCFDYETVADELGAAGYTWRSYASGEDEDGWLWSMFQAIKHIRHSSLWKADVISPQTRIFKDIRSGYLANVTWVSPTCATSDHGGCGGNAGPSWVGRIVDAVGESPFWDSTAIFVYWDEWGGWYDHVPPPYVDYDGLGARVPLLAISPYAKAGYVSHVQYEHGSVLKFIEDTFGLHRLAASDGRANSPGPDCFDFAQSPRPFQHIKTKYSEDDLMRLHAPGPLPPDMD